VFVDGVYAGRGGTPDIDALNLERIEVLRGPQGTLFGKNTVGGLIQYISRKPSNDTSLRVEGGYGNYDRWTLNARGNIPLSDKVYLAIGGSLKNRNGYEFNQTTGHHVNDEDLKTGTVALRFLPTEDLDIVLAADFTDQDQKGNPRDNLFASANYSLGALGFTARVQRYGEVSVAGATATNATGTLDQTYGAKTLTDLSASYTLRRITATIGADNVFDVYPDRNLNPGDPTTANGGISNFGIFPYNGISPFEFLVLPRMVALILMMPLLCVFADLIAISGGFLVSTLLLDLTPAVYLDRTVASIRLSAFLLGVCKGGFFGVLVALTGCMRGMQCGTNAAAVGQATTSAVVTGIAWIIASDGIFAVICNVLHI